MNKWIVFIVVLVSFSFSCVVQNKTKPINKELLQENIVKLLHEQTGYEPRFLSIDSVNNFTGFFICDLVDTLNYQKPRYNYDEGKDIPLIKFEEGHIYHFAYDFASYSYSNILFLKENSAIMFEAIDCDIFENEYEKMLSHFDENYNEVDKKEVRNRLMNYEKYGYRWGFDNFSYKLNCERLIEKLKGRKEPIRDLMNY